MPLRAVARFPPMVSDVSSDVQIDSVLRCAPLYVHVRQWGEKGKRKRSERKEKEVGEIKE